MRDCIWFRWNLCNVCARSHWLGNIARQSCFIQRYVGLGWFVCKWRWCGGRWKRHYFPSVWIHDEWRSRALNLKMDFFFVNFMITVLCILPFFLKMPNIIFYVMQKPFIKCVIRQRVGRFLHSRKKLIRRFQKKRQYSRFKI